MPRAYNSFKHLQRDFYAALRFTTTGSSTVSFATPPAFVTSLGFSICAWVQSNGSFSVAIQQIYQNIAASGTPPQFRITTAGALELLPRGGGSSLSGGAIPRGEWTHVACTWDNVTATHALYINGEIVASGTGTYAAGAFSQPADANIAMNTTSFASRLALWGYPLTQAQVRADMYSWTAPAPLALYELNQGYGSTGAAIDSQGGVAGNVNGCTWTDNVPMTPSRTGKDWASLYMDGTGDYVSLPSNTIGQMLAGQSGITISSWARMPTPGGTVRLVDLVNNGTAAGRLELQSTGTSFVGTFRGLDGEAAEAHSVTVPFAQNVWSLYTMQADFAGDKVRLYRNGLQFYDAAATFDSSALSWNATNTAALGAAVGGASVNLLGNLGEVRIDGVLTKSQIRDLYFGREAVTPLIRYSHLEGVGTTITNSGSIAGAIGTLQANTAWSLEAPW